VKLALVMTQIDENRLLLLQPENILVWYFVVRRYLEAQKRSCFDCFHSTVRGGRSNLPALIHSQGASVVIIEVKHLSLQEFLFSELPKLSLTFYYFRLYFGLISYRRINTYFES
jgi:hypothetical protein